MSKKQDAVIAVNATRDLLFEVSVLRDVVDSLRCDEDTEAQVMVLESVIAEKLHTAWHGVEFISETLTKVNRTKKSKKLAKAA